MKKIVVFFLLTFLLINIPMHSFADKPSITAKAAILIDAKTGQVLYEKNANDQLYPASTTKILTGLLAIENSNLNDEVVIDKEATLGIDGSHIALEPGEILTMEDLLHGLMIESANDVAKAIAIHVAGSVDEFAELMNKRAKELGANNSNFVNPNGLPNDEHLSSAHDLAMITKHALNNDIFANIVKEYKYTIETTNKKNENRYLKSSNRMLYSNEKINVNGNSVSIKYDGAIGVKTGYTQQAQQCLVSAAKRGDQTYIAVVLGAVGTNVYVDSHKLLNYGFDNFETKTLGFKNEFIENIDVDLGDMPFATGIIGENLNVILSKGQGDNITRNIVLPDKIKAPISKDQLLGTIEYKLNDEVIGRANIVSAMEVNQKAIHAVLDIEPKETVLAYWWLIPIILFAIWRTSIGLKRRKKRRRRTSTISYTHRKF